MNGVVSVVNSGLSIAMDVTSRRSVPALRIVTCRVVGETDVLPAEVQRGRCRRDVRRAGHVEVGRHVHQTLVRVVAANREPAVVVAAEHVGGVEPDREVNESAGRDRPRRWRRTSSHWAWRGSSIASPSCT